MGPIEPSSDTRQSAHVLMEMYLALRAGGFTEAQAMFLVGQVITANIIANKGEEP